VGYERDARDVEWAAWRGERAQLKRAHRSSLPNYGFAPPPIRMEYRYPRAVFFVLATKFFEAFAANGIRSKFPDFHPKADNRFLVRSKAFVGKVWLKNSETRLISGTEI